MTSLVKALIHVEDGEHLELVGSVSDVHIYLRGHCRKARFFNSLLWKRHVDTIEMRIVLQLPGRLFKILRINFLGTIYNCFFGYISLLTYKAHCVGRTIASNARILKLFQKSCQAFLTH